MDEPTTRPSIAACIARALSKIEANEIRATIASALFVFVLMSSYYVLRPVRDSMASNWTDSEVAFLWTLNFFISTAIVAVYGVAVTRLKYRHVVPAMYGFFAASFLLFYLGIGLFADADLVDKAFYLWVSVFALFNVSMFWTFMADTFSKEQSRRLFGVIAAGASAGTIVGPSIAILFAQRIGNDHLMLLAATSLVLVIPLVFYIYRQKRTLLGNQSLHVDTADIAAGGRWWEGFYAFLRNPFLLAIGGFILMYVCIGSFAYFLQKNLLVDFDEDTRTAIIGGVDLITNALTFVLALFLTGRIVTRFGMASGLALVPLLVAAGLLILALAPILTVLLAFQVARRGGNYGLTRPAREMLYTHVSQEERYKAKPVIDIVVYRGGDAVWASLFALLTDGLGLALSAMAGIGAAIAAAWAGLGVYLGRAFDRGSKDSSGVDPDPRR